LPHFVDPSSNLAPCTHDLPPQFSVHRCVLDKYSVKRTESQPDDAPKRTAFCQKVGILAAFGQISCSLHSQLTENGAPGDGGGRALPGKERRGDGHVLVQEL
jgi:hypothetical protein